MPSRSRYADALVDVSSRRSIRVADSAIQWPTTKSVQVDHFYHEQRFWRATIPLDGVEQIYGQVFNFSKPRTRRTKTGSKIVRDRHGIPKRTIPILSHLQCRFRFHEQSPIQLRSMRGGDHADVKHSVTDCVYSLEACGPFGVGFSLWDAMAGNLVSSHRFLSMRSMVFERLVLENHHVTESPPLPLNDSQKRRLLVEALRRSDSAGMSETYYLYRPFFTNNCTSNPFQILDEIVDYSLLHRIGSMLYRLPLNPRLYLRVRGMDSDPNQRTILRNEYADFLNAPDTRAQKREYLRQRRQRIRSQGSSMSILCSPADGGR